MPIDFDTVYMMTHPSGQLGDRVQQIVLGGRPVYAYDAHARWGLCWQFLTTGETGRIIFGPVDRDVDGVVDIRDVEKGPLEGRPVIWRFTPLTLAMWRPTVDDAVYEGRKELQAIKTDEALQAYYRTQFLYDWWERTP